MKRYVMLVDIISNDPPELSLDGDLPNGIEGVAYSYAYVATGGVAPLVYSVLGQLPAGVTIDSATGVVSGTPTETGSFNVTVMVTDSVNQIASNVDAFLVTATPIILVSPAAPDGSTGTTTYATWNPSRLPGAQIALTNANRKATGVSGTWKTLGGTDAKTTGKWAIRTTLNSSSGNTCFFGIASNQADGTWPSSILHSGAGASYADAIGYYNNGGQVEWTLSGSSGASPGVGSWNPSLNICEIGLDLTVSPPVSYWYVDGVLKYTKTLPIGKAWAPCASVLNTQAVEINAGQSTFTPSLAGASLWGTTTPAPYSHTYSASGGTAPYTWSITAGALPTGLSLNAATGEVTGNPSAAGSYSFTITAQDDNGVQGSLAETVVIT